MILFEVGQRVRVVDKASRHYDARGRVDHLMRSDNSAGVALDHAQQPADVHSIAILYPDQCEEVSE